MCTGTDCICRLDRIYFTLFFYFLFFWIARVEARVEGKQFEYWYLVVTYIYRLSIPIFGAF